MDFDVRIAHSVEEVGRTEWDRVGAGQPFSSYRWYRFGETILKGVLPVYITLYQGNDPLARGTFWLEWLRRKPTENRPIEYLIDLVTHRWPLLICRAPAANISALILPQDPELRRATLNTLIIAAREQARQHRVSFLIFDRLTHQEVHWEQWPADFASTSFGIQGTRLDIVWPDFQSYLQHLTPKTRKNYRRTIRSGERQGIQIKYNSSVTRLEEAMPLIDNIARRHQTSSSLRLADLLTHAHAVDSTWITAEIGNRLVGCELVLSDGDASFVTALGVDHTVENVYFLLGYSDIRLAIEKGIKVLRWGSMAYETKERLGFERDNNNYCVFTANHPLLTRIGKWLAGGY